ncbi:MAG TPA: hypothetical protein VKG44_02780, partial [Candidatus Baltobacteraceae bacterium]|nr:hypothetical protein [Candidatus Baltobacteraceae bacterium]
GERPEHVAYLEEWLARAQLDRVGFFSYSREESTPAFELSGQVSAAEKRRRLIRLREAQRTISLRVREARLGRTVRVLVEGRRTLRAGDPLRAFFGASSATAGRSMGEAPGVDGEVWFAGNAEAGTFVDVTLEHATSFDFAGTARAAVAA